MQIFPKWIARIKAQLFQVVEYCSVIGVFGEYGPKLLQLTCAGCVQLWKYPSGVLASMRPIVFPTASNLIVCSSNGKRAKGTRRPDPNPA